MTLYEEGVLKICIFLLYIMWTAQYSRNHTHKFITTKPSHCPNVNVLLGHTLKSHCKATEVPVKDDMFIHCERIEAEQ